MRILISIWIFYKKMIIPVMITSIVMGTLGEFVLPGPLSRGLTTSFPINKIGLVYIGLTPVFQYFIYEIRNPEEYYFYYNMGLSKLSLWIITFIISSVIGIILYVI